MKNVILFGIESAVRYKLEHWIGEQVNVVGYSDFGKIYDNCKTFEYKKFIRPGNLKDLDDLYDYIILSEVSLNSCREISAKLEAEGVKRSKILPSMLFAHPERAFTNTYDDFIKLNEKFQGLCFGMSYTRTGFMPHLFDNDWFKFSLGGADLHVHELWLSNLLKHHKELFSDIKYLFFELPYYIFNWDIQSSNQIYARMCYFDEFNDYETFIETKDDAVEYIEKYRVLKSMFAGKYEQSPGIYSNFVFDQRNLEQIIVNKKNSFFTADKIWSENYEKTIERNQNRIMHILKLSTALNIVPILCVYPLSPSFTNHNKDIVSGKRKQFYDILNKTGYQYKIIDLCEMNCVDSLFLDRDFRDLTHLNTGGGNKVSLLLNDLIKTI